MASCRRRLAMMGSSCAGGSGLRSHSQASCSSTGISSPLTTGRAFLHSTHWLNASRPRTMSDPALRMRIKSHSSLTSVWIGVAVPSNRFLVRGPTRSMKSSRLLDFHPAAGEQLVEFAVAVPVPQGFDFGGRFVPALLEGGFADVLRHHHGGGVQFAVAEDLDLRDPVDFLAHEFEDGTAEVAGDTTVGFGTRELT